MIYLSPSIDLSDKTDIGDYVIIPQLSYRPAVNKHMHTCILHVNLYFNILYLHVERALWHRQLKLFV